MRHPIRSHLREGTRERRTGIRRPGTVGDIRHSFNTVLVECGFLQCPVRMSVVGEGMDEGVAGHVGVVHHGGGWGRGSEGVPFFACRAVVDHQFHALGSDPYDPPVHPPPALQKQRDH